MTKAEAKLFCDKKCPERAYCFHGVDPECAQLMKREVEKICKTCLKEELVVIGGRKMND